MIQCRLCQLIVNIAIKNLNIFFLQILKTRPCVIQHKNAQMCVKYYNYLSGVMLHYEMIHHKAWYTYVEEIRSKLNLPLLKRNAKNWLELNLHQSVYQLIRETECCQKLGLCKLID